MKGANEIGDDGGLDTFSMKELGMEKPFGRFETRRRGWLQEF
jgi:hypothetical protein